MASFNWVFTSCCYFNPNVISLFSFFKKNHHLDKTIKALYCRVYKLEPVGAISSALQCPCHIVLQWHRLAEWYCQLAVGNVRRYAVKDCHTPHPDLSYGPGFWLCAGSCLADLRQPGRLLHCLCYWSSFFCGLATRWKEACQPREDLWGKKGIYIFS